MLGEEVSRESKDNDILRLTYLGAMAEGSCDAI